MRKALTAVLLTSAFLTVGTGLAYADDHAEPRVCAGGDVVVVDGNACVDDGGLDGVLGDVGDSLDEVLDEVGDLVDNLL